MDHQKGTIRTAVFFLAFLLFCCFSPLRAQFYNGSQLTFGKNRVQFNRFIWSFYRFEKYDAYFYQGGSELATYAARYTDKHLKEIEGALQTSLEEKIQFIIFKNLSDLKQSNIGLEVNWESYNTGGITRIIGGKVLLYFDGDYNHFEQQIRAGITQVILNEMIFGSGIGAQIKNNALFTMPEWYMNGLVAYLSEKWNTTIDNTVRDAVLNGKYRKFGKLTGEEATHAGHSLWHYIALQYGEGEIPNIVYMARLSRNVERGFLYVLGKPFNQLITEWIGFYSQAYESETTGRDIPSGLELVKHPRKERIYRQLKISPDGSKAAYVTHELGIHKVYIADLATGKRKKVYRGGYRIEEKQDYTFPLLAWHPTGDLLAILTERKGEAVLYFYTPEEKRFDKQILYNFDKICDLSYSDDGNFLVFSAVQRGQSDIFVYNIASGSYEQVTRDVYNDLQPRFINRSSDIVFSSNRVSDTIRFDPKVDINKLRFDNDLFIYHYKSKSNILHRVTNTPDVDETNPMPASGRYISYLSDENGIRNRYLARFDSVITYIDTATHYAVLTRSFPVTDYSRNLLEQDISRDGSKSGEVVLFNNRYSVVVHDQVPSRGQALSNIGATHYRTLLSGQVLQRTGQQDSIRQEELMPKKPKKKHFVTVMAGEAPAEQRLRPSAGETAHLHPGKYDGTAPSDSLLKRAAKGPGKDTSDKFRNIKQLNYYTEFSIDRMVTQLDFNYLNMSYQPFTGAKEPIFINPGLNALLMVGITDLMEDHRIAGGVRLNFDLVNNEYLLSYRYLTRRLDHQIIFHRQGLEEVGYYSYIRHKLYDLYYIATYPFTPVFNIRGTASLRYGRSVFLSTDQYNLQQPDVNRVWGNFKAELTYDNTRDVGLNLYNGTRYKIFGEYYTLFNKMSENMVVLGADFRHYRKLHRSMILALRVAASTSLGNNKLVYYMGGVDNWLFPSFDVRTPVATDQNYAFQTLATNMRGFRQNIRNGNSFAVLNAEIRVPVFRYLSNHPIKSDFLNNFQLVTFGDVGTAWTGLTPYSEENQLFTTYIDKDPFHIKVELLKEPVVEGFGLGLRSRLLGYFIRGDVAWGVEDGRVGKAVFYLSLSLDF